MESSLCVCVRAVCVCVKQSVFSHMISTDLNHHVSQIWQMRWFSSLCIHLKNVVRWSIFSLEFYFLCYFAYFYSVLPFRCCRKR